MLPVFVHDDAADTGLTHQLTDAPDLPRNQGCQALGSFIQNQHVRVGHEGTANGEHLLLTATELLTAMAQSFLEARKSL